MNGLGMTSARLSASLCLALASCAGPSGKEPPVLASPVGPALRALWDGAGGLEAWRRPAGFRLLVEAEPGPAWEEVARAPRLAPVRLRVEIGSGRRGEVGPAGEPAAGARGAEVPGGPLGDYAAGAAPELLAFPFSLAAPGWEFRRVVVPGKPVDPRGGFLAVPPAPSPHDACEVDLRPGESVCRGLELHVGHFAGRILWAELVRGEEDSGLRLPSQVTLYLPASSPLRDEGYPWEPVPATARRTGPPGSRAVLRLRVLEREVLQAESPAMGMGTRGGA